MKIKKSNLFFNLIILFPVIYIWYSLLLHNQGMRVFYYLYSMLCIASYLYYEHAGGISKKLLIFCILLGAMLSIDFLLFPDNESFTNAILIVLFCIYAYMYGDNEIRKKFYIYLVFVEKKVFNFYLIYLVGVLITILTGVGIYSGWGTISLQGPYGLAHIFAYELLVLGINSFMLFYDTHKIKWGILFLLFMLMMVLTNVRTTFLCAGIIVIYYFFVKKDYKKVIYFVLGLIAIYIAYIYTPLFKTIIEKTNNALETGDVTNARFIIWSNSFELFKRSDLFHKVFGNGMQNLMDYNLRLIRMPIHAHNDFIDLFSGYGLISFVLYSYSLVKITKGKHWLGFLLALGVLAWFNGVFSDCSFVISFISFRVFFDRINEIKPN